MDEWQKYAVHSAIENNLFVLTGGPGTGKTCVLKCIRFCLRKLLNTEDIVFCAPTGKASRRITESVGVKAFTVAKLLGLRGEDNDTPKPLNSKVCIVDEISMLDTYTAEALFKAVALSTKLILVGDVEQLPSVGYGSVLRDLIDAEIPCIKLEKTFRQASESGIFANIEAVKNGLQNGFIERDDFKILTSANDEEAKSMIINQFLDAIKVYGKEQVVCLTPYRRKGKTCAIEINRVLQNVLNSKDEKNSVSFTVHEEDGFKYDLTLIEGDPVMQLVNAEQVANGDVGFVKSINPEKRTVTVQFIDCDVVYNECDLEQLALAYAMSVHKSQGSEYACVITTSLTNDIQMLSRNTIYTAITRAKKECRIVVSDNNIAIKACRKESGYERITNLQTLIRHQESKYQLLKKL